MHELSVSAEWRGGVSFVAQNRRLDSLEGRGAPSWESNERDATQLLGKVDLFAFSQASMPSSVGGG